MTEESIDRSLLGTGWSFPPEFGARNRKAMLVSEEEDIRQSLRILLSTTPGERVMYSGYGCGLKSMVFRGMTLSDITQLKDLIERAVLFYEPRISLDDVAVNAEEMINGMVSIELRYTVRSTNSRSNMVYPFYLLEGTNIVA